MRSDTVFIVDDDPAMRDSLSVLVKSVGLQALAFGSADEFLRHVEAASPSGKSCLVLDVRMPGMSGPKLQERMRTIGCHVPIIFITGYGEVPTAVRAMRNGAIDYLEKPLKDQILLERIHECLERYSAPSAPPGNDAEAARRLEQLSPREREVLDFVVRGLTTKQIAQRLHRADKTIEFHRSNIMRKIGASNVAELVRIVSGVGAV